MEDEQKTAKEIFLECAIDRFEGNAAVLLTPDKNEIVIPKKYLPKNIGEGGAVVVRINERAETEARREQTAKDILNELFGQNSQ